MAGTYLIVMNTSFIFLVMEKTTSLYSKKKTSCEHKPQYDTIRMSFSFISTLKNIANVHIYLWKLVNPVSWNFEKTELYNYYYYTNVKKMTVIPNNCTLYFYTIPAYTLYMYALIFHFFTLIPLNASNISFYFTHCILYFVFSLICIV